MLCSRHNMYHRIFFIYSHLDCFSNENFLYLMNNWDRELIQFKLPSEVNWITLKMCHIEWSPEVGFWLSQQWLLACVKVFIMGQGPPNPQHLFRDCLCTHLFWPFVCLPQWRYDPGCNCAPQFFLPDIRCPSIMPQTSSGPKKGCRWPGRYHLLSYYARYPHQGTREKEMALD